ncbi:MAG: hypothetical protein JWN62_2156 [Acidimicrobiales bacterium]|nr:hypothetical protein [Acidimicrobiales bacterium]
MPETTTGAIVDRLGRIGETPCQPRVNPVFCVVGMTSSGSRLTLARVRSVADCVVGGVFALTVVGCVLDPKPLPPEQVVVKIAAACAAHKTAFLAGTHATAGPDFTRESLHEYGPFGDDALGLIREIRAEKDQRVQLDALYQAVDRLLVPRDAAQSALDEGDWKALQTSIDAGKAQLVQLDTAAAALSLPECASPTWFGSWFDEAQKYHDEQVEANKPAGDFMTEVKAACGRLGKDIADAPSTGSSIDIYLWAGTIDEAIRVFVRDVKNLEVPEGKQREVSALMASADALSADLSKLQAAALQGATGLGPSVESAFFELLTTMAVSC